MRTLSRVGALSAVAAAAVFCAPAAAHATATAVGHGDNGTVKIHDAATGEELRKNEPHVCEFYLDAFGFDSVQKVDWHIEAWAPTAAVKGETVESGAITLDGEGHGRTEDMTLPDGHYKLFWNFEGENGSAKHKVFWSECEDEEEGGGTATPSTPASESPGEPTSEPSASPSTPAEAAPSASPSPQGGAEGDLAETGNGAPVGLLSAAAAALLGAGGYLVFRRRKA
ncbi:LPXTG cell wall anchor domain-containing protein [Streptomyces cyaneochromogenes]|uniref:LPXTG cell wall anchor domain-containing protein n=1 Tax=Streptomyces cyaneochromogenes TaxID=2496836 RepID=A0A3Q9ESQ1_9ACTN|nr:LPXTG cell wall anchor domain-containing protein [Streptomyces cyaneochromogenes]AZQ35297.1 LPXTG cell wall anchor domain-containing protein [Streptomyces cyaneochromogenes]